MRSDRRISPAPIGSQYELALDSRLGLVSKCWRLAKCLIRRNICCSSKTKPPLREADRRTAGRPRLSRSNRPNRARPPLAQLADFAFDIIITDLRLPGIDGSAVVEAAVERYPDIIAIVVTGYGTVKDAVEAIKRGASDFVSKPFQIDELLHVLDSALEQRRLKSENAYLRAQLEERYRFEGHRRQEPGDGAAVPAARDRRRRPTARF